MNLLWHNSLLLSAVISLESITWSGDDEVILNMCLKIFAIKYFFKYCARLCILCSSTRLKKAFSSFVSAFSSEITCEVYIQTSVIWANLAFTCVDCSPFVFFANFPLDCAALWFSFPRILYNKDCCWLCVSGIENHILQVSFAF